MFAIRTHGPARREWSQSGDAGGARLWIFVLLRLGVLIGALLGGILIAVASGACTPATRPLPPDAATPLATEQPPQLPVVTPQP